MSNRNGKFWKGIILAGGRGSRLAPLTNVVNKHLLPVYDKPMIYYPLTTLMMCGIKDILVISTPDSIIQLEQLLEDGSKWGLNIDYSFQEEPRGIADSFLVAESFIDGYSTALVLGDNIFYGSGLPKRFREAMSIDSGATILGYEVANPSAFGVVELDDAGRAVEIVEKPEAPKSNMAVPGLYFYDEQVLSIAKTLKPSPRGELEISDINQRYLTQGQLRVVQLGRGTAWLEGGTHSDLFEAGQFIKVIEDRTGLKIACPEEVAYREGFITKDDLRVLIEGTSENEYKIYLENLLSVSYSD